MFYPNREFVRGSDGRIYEIEDSNRGGGVFVGVMMVMMGAAYVLEQAYLWLISHYLLIGIFSLFGFITWVGWIYHEYQQKEATKSMIKKILGIVVIFAGLNVAANGYTVTNRGSKLLNDIKGDWTQVDADVNLTIDGKQFYLDVDGGKTEVKAEYKTRLVDSKFLELSVNGTTQTKGENNNQPYSFSQIYYCDVINDTLYMTIAGNGQYVFTKN